MAKCVFRLKGGKLCGKNGKGNPPICDKHYEEMRDAEEEDEDFDDGPPMGFEYVEEIVDVVAEHPKVQGVFHKAGSILDRFANAVDMFASGKWAPPPPGTGPEPTGDAPPRQERQQRRQHHAPPPNPHREQQARVAQALLIFGWPAGKVYTEDDVRKRKRDLNKVYHPDANSGDDTMAKKVNAAADELLKAIGK